MIGNVKTIKFEEVPALSGNQLFLDYISGSNSALQFFTHSPYEFEKAIEKCTQRAYQRESLADALYELNNSLGAGCETLENIDTLRDEKTFCIITGQQTGLMGGPVYSLYKIATAIRLAEHLTSTTDYRFVPIFWGATEDHDFDEINHAYVLKETGDAGKVSFSWKGRGQAVENIELSDSIRMAIDEIVADSYSSDSDEIYNHQNHGSFCDWVLSTWLKLFAEEGLIVVDPRSLRRFAKPFFLKALQSEDVIHDSLHESALHLREKSYPVYLNPEVNGSLYTFDGENNRVRISNPLDLLAKVEESPELFSTDAALRPLFADYVLPVCGSVLGPGEISYQAMLKPLYKLFDIPQPVLFPRQGYTVVDDDDLELLNKYQTSIEELLAGNTTTKKIFSRLVPSHEFKDLEFIRKTLTVDNSPLQGHLENVKEHNVNVWKRGKSKALKRFEKIEEKMIKDRMKQLGFSKKDLHYLRNRIMPRNSLQERILPASHFIGLYGRDFVKAILQTGDLFDFSHKIVEIQK